LDAGVSTYTYVAIANGEVADITDDVRRLTGHPATTLADAAYRRSGSGAGSSVQDSVAGTTLGRSARARQEE
jgi:hypothetical protein